MKNRLVITTKHNRICCGYFLDDVPAELYCEEKDHPVTVGNIYAARVDRIADGIGAVFLDIGGGEKCYIPLNKAEKALKLSAGHEDRLYGGDIILVQIKKDAVKTKLPVAGEDISFTGKYVVLTLGERTRKVSKKIKDQEERDRLKSLMKAQFRLLPEPGMGVVIRTNAAGLAEEELRGEFETLAERACSLLKRARAAAGGSLLQKQPSLYMKLARELPKDRLQEIVTDSTDIFYEMQEYFSYMGDREDLEKLRLYEDDYSLYKLYRFDTHYQRALSRYVPLKSGGSLVIEQTEAMVVIDVNTGAAIKGKQDRKSIFPQMNREAALEIARQIRLRSLSGMILIDFINLKEEEEKRELLQYLRKCTVEDRAWVQVVDITGLGIVEMTRNKQWRSLAEQVPADFFSDTPEKA